MSRSAHRGGAGPHPSSRLCRVLGVSPSGFYAWSTRQPSARAVANAALTARIRAVHGRSRGIYGAPRVHAELRVQGTAAARKRVARLMREAGLVGCRPRGSAARRSPTRRPKPLTWCSGAFVRATWTGSGSRTSPMFGPTRAGCTWRPSSTPGPAGWSAGRWPITCAPSWRWTPSPWRWPDAVLLPA